MVQFLVKRPRCLFEFFRTAVGRPLFLFFLGRDEGTGDEGLTKRDEGLGTKYAITESLKLITHNSNQSISNPQSEISNPKSSILKLPHHPNPDIRAVEMKAVDNRWGGRADDVAVGVMEVVVSGMECETKIFAYK